MRTRTTKDYAEHVLTVANRELFDDIEETVLLTGRTWADFQADTDAARRLVFERSVAQELRAIRQSLERIEQAKA